MADTRQIVRWALDQSCKLRKQGEAVTPDKALGAVDYARTYSHGLRNREGGFGVFGDIHVSWVTAGYRPGPKRQTRAANYPAGGFIISEAFRDIGSPAELFAMCAPCSANTTPSDLAGCCGTLSQWPDSVETEAQIRSIIELLGIEADFQSGFPATTPIWYGLWAVSPVPAASLPLLRTIISEMREEDAREMEENNPADQRQLRDFALFVKAAELAEKHQLPLHVSLTPPGHTDFGFYTRFPHCPFCKAATRTPHWQRKYPSALYACHVCGREYSPAETAGEERMEEPAELRDMLGPSRFRQFANEYLIALGQTPENAALIVAETEAQEELRQQKLEAMRALHAKKDAYLAEHIFVGLASVSPPPGQSSQEDIPNPRNRWFDANAFAEVLRRCAAKGVVVTLMLHDSLDGKTDRNEMRTANIPDPLALLDQWREEGCDGKFHASFNVPDKLVS